MNNNDSELDSLATCMFAVAGLDLLSSRPPYSARLAHNQYLASLTFGCSDAGSPPRLLCVRTKMHKAGSSANDPEVLTCRNIRRPPMS